MVFDTYAHSLASSASEVPLSFPSPGWVEQDPLDLLKSVVENARQALAHTNAQVLALGLANQGETVVMWNKRTGQPLYNAINWQDRRTDSICEDLAQSGKGSLIQQHTGLPLDPYFSATKICWLLNNVPGARELAADGNLLAGTSDAWLLWNLTGNHYTDHATASRTMLYNPWLRDWDQEVLDLLEIPRSILPDIQSNTAAFGTVQSAVFGRALPVTASIVDQQAALFGQACFKPGDVKVTYGTGGFILLNMGANVTMSRAGLIPTVAWSLGQDFVYALDGGIYIAGAAIQWLRDGLGIISSVDETASIAASVTDSADVFFVPALAGLGAPYWDSYARGTIVGLTRGTTRAHIVRATLEGVAFNTRDVLEAMACDAGHPIKTIKADGGASSNSFLMQSLSDILGAEVQVAAMRETTALGVGFLACLGAGLWSHIDETLDALQSAVIYTPRESGNIDKLYLRWHEAVERAKGWAATPPSIP